MTFDSAWGCAFTSCHMHLWNLWSVGPRVAHSSCYIHVPWGSLHPRIHSTQNVDEGILGYTTRNCISFFFKSKSYLENCSCIYRWFCYYARFHYVNWSCRKNNYYWKPEKPQRPIYFSHWHNYFYNTILYHWIFL